MILPKNSRGIKTMNILHCITYTAKNEDNTALIECNTRLTRNKTITSRGAERILRKAGIPVVSVVRIETFVDQR